VVQDQLLLLLLVLFLLECMTRRCLHCNLFCHTLAGYGRGSTAVFVSADVMNIATLLCPSWRAPLSSFGPLLAEFPVADLQPTGALLPAVEGGPHCITQHAACMHTCHALYVLSDQLDCSTQCHTPPICTMHMLALLIQQYRPQPQIAAEQRTSRLANTMISLTHCVPVQQSMCVRRLAISWMRCAA